MDAKRNGAMPAHPVIGAPGAPEDYAGLTKRELFAMTAMQGLLANPYYAQEVADRATNGTLASAAVWHADQLLAELAKEDES